MDVFRLRFYTFGITATATVHDKVEAIRPPILVSKHGRQYISFHESNSKFVVYASRSKHGVDQLFANGTRQTGQLRPD